MNFDVFLDKIRMNEISEKEMAKYLKPIMLPGTEGASIPSLLPLVDRLKLGFLSALPEFVAEQVSNAVREGRNQLFLAKLEINSSHPVLVTEGDSWFQFPVFIADVIDYLKRDYAVRSLGRQGDTLGNIAGIPGPANPANELIGRYKSEYLNELQMLKSQVRGFVLSAAGNDIIGELPVEGGGKKRALQDILQNPGVHSENPWDYINPAILDDRKAGVKSAYQKIIDDIHAEPGLETLPIFVHGYDYVFPYPWPGEGDSRSHVWSRPLGKWLGQALNAAQIDENRHEFRRQILKELIDDLYRLLEELAAENSNVHVVDCRGAMPTLDLWKDEIHGTDEGFQRVAARFRAKINAVIA